MTNINVYLRENLDGISSRLHIAPHIEEKKLNNAVKAFGFSGSAATVVALFDNALFKSGKEGLLLTGERLIYRASFSDPVDMTWASIASVEYVEKMTGSKGDKKEIFLLIRRKQAADVSVTGLTDCNYHKLAEILQGGIDGVSEFGEERQLIPIDELDEPLKVAYVQVVINMAHDNHQSVNDREFAEILQLMTRLDLSSDARFALRAYMVPGSEQVSLNKLLDTISAHSPSGQIRPLHVSLVKDMINVYYSMGEDDIEDFTFLQNNRELFRVSDEEIELVVMAIKNDRDMLRDDLTDDQLVSALKLLSAKAAAVGTPLAAVYLSGSVAGMSAAGLTSGLASLGMGGLLGMSGMVTGIGVAVLIGVGTYAGVRKLTGANELTRFKRRELMLNEIIKQTQLTISLVMKDINFITEKLNEAIQAHNAQGDKIRQLAGLMSQMTSAGAVLTEKTGLAQASATRLRCARHLDEGKLRSLTREPTKAELYYLILEGYQPRSVVISNDDDTEEKTETRLCLKPDQSHRQLEHLAKAFEAIGYFKVGDVLMGSASEAAGKARERLGSLFS